MLNDDAVRTAIVSDLHLGPRQRRRPAAPRRASSTGSSRSRGADRLVLLGDVLELRDRPLTEVLEGSAPVMAALAEAWRGASW